MIIKHKDGRDEDIKELNRLVGLPISAKQRFLVERELKCLRSGESNEEAAAYYLNFSYKDLKNWMVIHDLRLEHRGRVAQIDHILINRVLDVYVLESKNYYYGVKITDNGEFMVWNGKGYHGIESPIEQNNRHAEALSQTIEDRKLAPERLGFPMPVNFVSYVLISPTSRIDRPKPAKFDTSMVVKADAIVSAIDEKKDKIPVSSALKFIGLDTLEEFAQRIARLHRPMKIDYAAKFGIEETRGADQSAVSRSLVSENTEAYTPKETGGGKSCQKCGVTVDNKVVFYCSINKQKFNGQIFCRDCQKV